MKNLEVSKVKLKIILHFYLLKKYHSFADGAIAISSRLKNNWIKLVKNKIPIELIPISVDFK